MNPCIFCEIVSRKSPASVVFEDSDVMALLDTNPVQRGHTLVNPKKHFVDIWDIPAEVLTKVVSASLLVAHRMKEAMDTEGVNTFCASGKPAGQDIFHFHMNVIPLARDERSKFAKWWSSSTETATRSDLDNLASQLRFR